MGNPRAGRSQAQRFRAPLTQSGAVILGMYRLELREGKALMGSSVGADEGQGGRLGGQGGH